MFVLGTAQFGFPYAGSKKLFLVPEIKDILAAAFDYGVRELDTAIAYGQSEELLGSADVTKFFVNTKLPPSVAQNETSIEKILDLSLSRLKLQQINTLFIHDVDNFSPQALRVAVSLNGTRKARGRILSIGISVYSRDEIEISKIIQCRSNSGHI